MKRDERAIRNLEQIGSRFLKEILYYISLLFNAIHNRSKTIKFNVRQNTEISLEITFYILIDSANKFSHFTEKSIRSTSC